MFTFFFNFPEERFRVKEINKEIWNYLLTERGSSPTPIGHPPPSGSPPSGHASGSSCPPPSGRSPGGRAGNCLFSRGFQKTRRGTAWKPREIPAVFAAAPQGFQRFPKNRRGTEGKNCGNSRAMTTLLPCRRLKFQVRMSSFRQAKKIVVGIISGG